MNVIGRVHKVFVDLLQVHELWTKFPLRLSDGITEGLTYSLFNLGYIRLEGGICGAEPPVYINIIVIRLG